MPGQATEPDLPKGQRQDDDTEEKVELEKFAPEEEAASNP
jgi:hypothetical protein